MIDPVTGEIGVFLRAPHNYDTNAASDETALLCPPGEGMTQQQFKEEADINTIVARFGLTGTLPEVVRVPKSGDFTGVVDYHSALNAVRQADEAFMELPGEMRARFRNDPQELLMFLSDEKNKEEAMKIGLIPKPDEVTRATVQPVTAAT